MIAPLTLAFALLGQPAASAAADAWFMGSLEAPAATVNAPGQISLEPSFGVSNAYGGGRGTSGSVSPGRTLAAYLSAEYAPALEYSWSAQRGVIVGLTFDAF